MLGSPSLLARDCAPSTPSIIALGSVVSNLGGEPLASWGVRHRVPTALHNPQPTSMSITWWQTVAVVGEAVCRGEVCHLHVIKIDCTSCEKESPGASIAAHAYREDSQTHPRTCPSPGQAHDYALAGIRYARRSCSSAGSVIWGARPMANLYPTSSSPKAFPGPTIMTGRSGVRFKIIAKLFIRKSPLVLPSTPVRFYD